MSATHYTPSMTKTQYSVKSQKQQMPYLDYLMIRREGMIKELREIEAQLLANGYICRRSVKTQADRR